MIQKFKQADHRLPYNSKLIDRAKWLRKNMTPPEKKIWYDYLQGLNYRVLRQRPINNFIVDFYISALSLVIEIDGESHFDEVGKIYDRERTNVLESYGLQVIRFTNEEIMKNFTGVCEILNQKLKHDKK